MAALMNSFRRIRSSLRPRYAVGGCNGRHLQQRARDRQFPSAHHFISLFHSFQLVFFSSSQHRKPHSPRLGTRKFRFSTLLSGTRIRSYQNTGKIFLREGTLNPRERARKRVRVHKETGREEREGGPSPRGMSITAKLL